MDGSRSSDHLVGGCDAAIADVDTVGRPDGGDPPAGPDGKPAPGQGDLRAGSGGGRHQAPRSAKIDGPKANPGHRRDLDGPGPVDGLVDEHPVTTVLDDG